MHQLFPFSFFYVEQIENDLIHMCIVGKHEGIWREIRNVIHEHNFLTELIITSDGVTN